MDYQLQYINVVTGVIAVVATEELDNPTETEINDWVRDLQAVNIVPPDCQSEVYNENEDGFISGGL